MNLIEKANKGIIFAQFKTRNAIANLKTKTHDLMNREKSGIDQVVVMLILIAVGAALLGIIYLIVKTVVNGQWKKSFTDTMTNWFGEAGSK